MIKINSDLFSKNINKKDKTIDDILKASQEYSNQIMGIINFNLNNSGKKFKIGLPQSYDLTTSRVNLGKLLIPSMILTTNSREIANLIESSAKKRHLKFHIWIFLKQKKEY